MIKYPEPLRSVLIEVIREKWPITAQQAIETIEMAELRTPPDGWHLIMKIANNRLIQKEVSDELNSPIQGSAVKSLPSRWHRVNQRFAKAVG